MRGCGFPVFLPCKVVCGSIPRRERIVKTIRYPSILFETQHSANDRPEMIAVRVFRISFNTINMKHKSLLQVLLIAFAFYAILLAAAIGFVYAAENNYKKAVQAAMQTEGTDGAIEAKMAEYGFDVDACDMNEPDFRAKVNALFN